MKKLLLGAITTLAFLFGFASCNGDLHDDYIKPWYIEGAITSGRTVMAVNNETGIMSYAFTYNSETMNSWDSSKGDVHFKIMVSASGWDDDFGLGGKSVPINAKDDEGNDEYTSLIPRGDDDPQHIVISGLTDGKEYTIFINGDAIKNTASILVKGADAVVYPDLYIVSQKLDKMTLENGVYKRTNKLPVGNYSFSIFDGTTSYGVKTDSIELDKEIELISTDDAKPITITVAEGEAGEYRISAIIDADIVKLTVKRLASFAQINDITKFDGGLYQGNIEWEADGDDLVAAITISGEINNAWWTDGTAEASISDVKFGFLLKDSTGNKNYRSKSEISVGETVTITSDLGDNDAITGIKGSFGEVKGDKGEKPSSLILASPVSIILRSTADSIIVKFEQQS